MAGRDRPPSSGSLSESPIEDGRRSTPAKFRWASPLLGFWPRAFGALRLQGARSFVREHVYWSREAVVVVKDLDGGLPYASYPENGGLVLAEISRELIENKSVVFKYRDRAWRAAHYLEKGYRNLGLIAGGQIIGDVWAYSPSFAPESSRHGDLDWLGVPSSKTLAYVFDGFLDPDMRRRNLAGYLLGTFLRRLRDLEVERAYAYFWADNTPSLWLHRLLKWNELKRLKVRRFGVFLKVAAEMPPRWPPPGQGGSR
jgi:GNAT superfamily N-acetyltransferase